MRRLGGVGEVHFQGKRKKKKKKTPTKSGVDGKIIGTKKKKKLQKMRRTRGLRRKGGETRRLVWFRTGW